jgi:hypothetical protein
VRARRGVEQHRVAEAVVAEPRHLRERERLVRAEVGEQRGRGARGRVLRVAREPIGVRRRGRRRVARDLDLAPHGARQLARERRRELHVAARQQQLARLDAPQLVAHRRREDLARAPGRTRRAQLAGRRVEDRHAELVARAERAERELARRLEAVGVAHEAWRHHLDHLAPHELARCACLLHLLADRDAQPLRGQARQVLIGRVHGHAAHRHGVGLALVARGQRDVEQRRGELGVAQEHLVEVAHTVEDDRIRVLRLDREVLAHHRRVEGGAAHSSSSLRCSRPLRSSTSSSSAYSFSASPSR